MISPLQNVTTLDSYDPSTTVTGPGIVRVNVQVNNAAILYQLLDRGPPGGVWGPAEVFLLPGQYSFARACGGFRCRSALQGTPAQVSAELITREQLP